MRELTGDLRKAFRLYADDVCAIDVSGIRAKYWSAGRRQRMNARIFFFVEATRKVYQMLDKEGERCRFFLQSTKQK